MYSFRIMSSLHPPINALVRQVIDYLIAFAELFLCFLSKRRRRKTILLISRPVYRFVELVYP